MVNFVTLHVIKFTINYMEALTFDTTEKILLAATGVLFVIQILYYFCLYNRIHLHNRAVKRSNVHFSQELPPVSSSSAPGKSPRTCVATSPRF